MHARCDTAAGVDGAQAVAMPRECAAPQVYDTPLSHGWLRRSALGERAESGWLFPVRKVPRNANRAQHSLVRCALCLLLSACAGCIPPAALSLVLSVLYSPLTNASCPSLVNIKQPRVMERRLLEADSAVLHSRTAG